MQCDQVVQGWLAGEALTDRLQVFACSAKQAKRLLKQPGATALFAMAKEQTEGHCKSVYVAGLSDWQLGLEE